jgi:hypothetical protein
MSQITIGTNIFRSKTTPIVFQSPDRFRHMYMIGKTGVGKSTVYENMALQDIQNGNGVCFIDPHGESIDWLLERIPENRVEDVVLFDPADSSYPLGLNLLEAKTEQERDFLVSELIQIFYKLFDPEKTGIIGPQFEHWLRNAALTVMAGPDGGTLAEIPKLFIDKKYEAAKRKHVKDPIVREFWSKQMDATADFHKSEMLNYFSSKFGGFLNNRLMRNIIGQRESSFSFENIIDQEKILLVNLSKGKIGEMNAAMLGLILVAKLEAAVLKRANIPSDQRHPFYLYVDEFQNVITDSFTTMLSEARKYGLGIHITNQYFSQLPEDLRNAILGNVGTLLAFEVSAEDAEILTKEFAPFTKEDFFNLKKYNFYIRLMMNGKMSPAFSGQSLPPAGFPNPHIADRIKGLGHLAYGFPRLLVEEQIKQALF